MPSKMHMKRGFTLVEAIVALGVLVAIIALIMPGIARFLTMTRADFLNMCLWESAMSEFNRVKANPDAVGRTNTYTCGAIVVNTRSFLERGNIPQTPHQSGSGNRACAIVRVEATAQGRNAVMRGPVCRFF